MPVTAPTLPLDQVDPVAFLRIHASQVCLGRHPSIEYQLALAVIQGPLSPVSSSQATEDAAATHDHTWVFYAEVLTLSSDESSSSKSVCEMKWESISVSASTKSW